MALGNRRKLAELLCTAAWKSLRKMIQTEQDYDPAAMMVLHTWNQQLEAHWHVHALVPGGGPGLSDGRWKECQAPPLAEDCGDRPSPTQEVKEHTNGYLVDAINLRTAFRKFAIAYLNRLRKSGQLKFDGELAYLQEDAQWETLLQELESVDWVQSYPAATGRIESA